MWLKKLKLLWYNGFGNIWRILNWQIWNTCSSSVMLCWTRGTLYGRMRYRNTLRILSYIVCFISVSGCKDTIWKYLFPVIVKKFVVFINNFFFVVFQMMRMHKYLLCEQIHVCVHLQNCHNQHCKWLSVPLVTRSVEGQTVCISDWCSDSGVHWSIVWHVSRQMIGIDSLCWQDVVII